MGRWRGLGSFAALAVLNACCLTAVAHADVQSDQPAAILVFPKLLVDAEGSQPAHVDTLVRITNASNSPVTLQCFYVNTTPTCTGGTGNCITNQRFTSIYPDCTGTCEPKWQETDFHITLTENQPVAWLVSNGAVDCRSTPNGTDNIPDNQDPCFPLDGIFRIGPRGGSNANSRVPPISQLPFIGELKCVTVDENDQPIARNDVYGSASIIETAIGSEPKFLDVSSYNAIGIQALPQNNGDHVLVLGRPGTAGVEYNGCPNILILDHFFDFAIDPIALGPVTTDLTLVPCSEDFLHQAPETITVQFLVFNEFEQRLSTSRPVTCFREIQISNIDTQTNDRSIFTAQVMGTLTGQTRIRGVADSRTDIGRALLGVAEEYRPSGTAAFNLQTQGIREQNDFIYLP